MNESNEWGMNDEQDEQDKDLSQRKQERTHAKFFTWKNNNDNTNEKRCDWNDNNNNDDWAKENEAFEVEGQWQRIAIALSEDGMSWTVAEGNTDTAREASKLKRS